MSKDSKKSLSQYLDSDSIEIDKKDVVKTLQEHISKSGSKGLTSILADLIVKNHSLIFLLSMGFTVWKYLIAGSHFAGRGVTRGFSIFCWTLIDQNQDS